MSKDFGFKAFLCLTPSTKLHLFSLSRAGLNAEKSFNHFFSLIHLSPSTPAILLAGKHDWPEFLIRALRMTKVWTLPSCASSSLQGVL